MHSLTQINHFQRGEEPVLKVQVLCRCFAAVILDEGEAACPQDVVVGPLHCPVEVGQTELVVVDRAVADTERGPRREAALQQVAGQQLGGARPRARPAERAGEQGDLQEEPVSGPQEVRHDSCGTLRYSPPAAPVSDSPGSHRFNAQKPEVS